MSGLGVQVAVIRDAEVLLIQRKDFQVWGLPGGEIEAGETPTQAAIREVAEETGLEVSLTRFVGLYSMPQWIVMNTTIAVFAATVSGGSLKPDPNETMDVGFFSEAQLPQRLMWWHRQRIADALKGIGGSVVWTQNAPWLEGVKSRHDLYELREKSGLSGYEFFQSISLEGPETIDIEGKIVD
jgi:ADP-ribose pyrophosphatase YjhB (NUDIX family)